MSQATDWRLPQPTEAEREAAWLYRHLHTGNPGDVAFYVEACRGAGSVLELGCGAGRVLVPVAEAGAEVVGLELDAGMLEACAAAVPGAVRQRVTLVHGDMRDFDLGREFDRVTVPFNGLFVLESEADQLACLRAAARHLAPQGRLVFDVYAVEDDVDLDVMGEGDDPFEYLTSFRADGVRVDVEERELVRGEPGRIDMEYRYRLRPRGGAERVVHQTVRHCFVRPSRLRPLLAEAGLQVVNLWGDFDREPFGEDSERMVVVARRRR